MWCKRGEVLVAWRCVVQGHRLKLLWPYLRTCLHLQPVIVPTTSIFQPERGKKKKPITGDAWGSSSLPYSWKYIGVRPFRYGRVRRIVVSRVVLRHVHELKSQANPSKKGGKKRAKRVVKDDSSSEGSCDGEPLSLAKEEKRQLARGNASLHSMRLYRPPFTCGQCNRAVYLWCIFCDGCIQCLVGVECLARRFKDRDEVKWVLQKWEKQVHVESILHPTPSMNVDGSSTSVAEASSTPLDPVPPSSIPSGIVFAAPSGDHPTSPTGCRGAEQILADVCKALSDSQGSFRPSMLEVEALLGNDRRQPLHVTVPGLSPQQF